MGYTSLTQYMPMELAFVTHFDYANLYFLLQPKLTKYS